MPNIFGIIIVALVLFSAVVAVIQLITGDFARNETDTRTPLGQLVGMILLGILFLYLLFK